MTHRFPEDGQRTAVFAGSFNPFTVGHLSILKRGLEIFDKVIVMIGHNASKKDDLALRRVFLRFRCRPFSRRYGRSSQ